MNTHAFTKYDIRGKIGRDIDTQFVYRLGHALNDVFHPESLVIGKDVRLSSDMLEHILCSALRECGIDVILLGLCGTEEISFAVQKGNFDLGVMITASHNPVDENGFKCIHRNGIPLTEEELLSIRDSMENWPSCMRPSQTFTSQDASLASTASADAEKNTPCHSGFHRRVYLQWLLDYTHATRAKPLKIVADAGNGCAGIFLEELAKELPHTFYFLHVTPDGAFPHGVPNPLVPENRNRTAERVRETGADLGLAWDGDFDRCFFYTNRGQFVEGAYIVGFLAFALLQQTRGAKIIHDPRVYWNTCDLVRAANGIPVMSRTGHALMKASMRRENAIYGGEMSAHHYFRDFACCDSGMLPWLLVINALESLGQGLGDALAERMERFPTSGEINIRHAHPEAVLQHIQMLFGRKAVHEDHLDGLNMEFAEWRFNLRSSNTEPVMRLNVEGRADRALVEERTAALLQKIQEIP